VIRSAKSHEISEEAMTMSMETHQGEDRTVECQEEYEMNLKRYVSELEAFLEEYHTTHPDSIVPTIRIVVA
jgi:hypothetical protein